MSAKDSSGYLSSSAYAVTQASQYPTLKTSVTVKKRPRPPSYRSILAPPTLRSCYSHENVGATNVELSTSGQHLFGESVKKRSTTSSIRGFWQPARVCNATPATVVRKPDLSSFSGGIVSKMLKVTRRRPSGRSPSKQSTSSGQCLPTTREPAPPGVAVKTSSSKHATTSASQPPVSSWSRYFDANGTHGDISSSLSTMMCTQNENNVELFATNVDRVTSSFIARTPSRSLSKDVVDSVGASSSVVQGLSPKKDSLNEQKASTTLSTAFFDADNFSKFRSFLPPEFVTTSTTSLSSQPLPFANAKTGVVFQRAASIDDGQRSEDSSSSSILTGTKRFLPTENERALSVQRVTQLAKQFENGDVDQMGPLKQYHTQVYKRELQKICAQNYGSVLMKAHIYENPNPPPRLALTVAAPMGSSGDVVNGQSNEDAASAISAASSFTDRQQQNREGFYNEKSLLSPTCSDSGVGFRQESTTFKGNRQFGSDLAVASGVKSNFGEVTSSSDVFAPNVSMRTRTATQKRQFASLTPFRQESFLQAITNSSVKLACVIQGVGTAATTSLARIPENDTLPTNSYRSPLLSFPTPYTASTMTEPRHPMLSYSFSTPQPPMPSAQLTFERTSGGDGSKVRRKTVSFLNEPSSILSSDMSWTPFSGSTSPVSDERLQEIDRKTRRGSYIMATTYVGGGGAVGASSSVLDSPLKQRSSPNVFTDSTSTTLSFNTNNDYAGSDGDITSSSAAAATTAAAMFATPSRIANNDNSPRSSQLLLNSAQSKRESSFFDDSGAASADAHTPTTPIPSSPSVASSAKQIRMQRILNFFSGDQAWNKQIGADENQSFGACSTSPSTSREVLNDFNSSAAAASTMSPRNGRRSTTSALKSRKFDAGVTVTFEGPLVHKQTMVADGRRSNERVWRNYYAVLADYTLYLCKERPFFNDEEVVTLPEDVIAIDVDSCIADIAYDYGKRKNVFRITTQQQSEHLLQAEDGDAMLKWLENLQRCNSLENNPGVLSSSMALIIKRYEAQSQSVSPSVKQRRPAFLKGSLRDASSSSSNDTEVQHRQASLPAATVVDGNASSSVEKGDKQEKGDSTPSKSRKWRKVRKSGSCPVPSPRGKDATSNSDSMFGALLEECPTSGENDFVPLIVQLCVKVVEHHGLTTVGVYRIPGNTAAVNSLIASLDKGFENTDFNDPRWRDVNVVSSLLKAFLRKLPDPLLTDRHYQLFIDGNRIENHAQRLHRLRQLLRKLPRTNYETLKYLAMHLRKVVSHSHINKMEARNLALMFGPSLVRPSGESMATMVTHMSDQCKIIESLILYCDYIFACDDSGDVPPAPLPIEYAKENFANTSFADMNDLLRRVSKTEEELEKTKDSIVKSIWKARRGSRKSKKEINGFICEEQSETPSPSIGNGHAAKEELDNFTASLSQDEPHRRLSFNERNIDEEIETRRRQSVDDEKIVASQQQQQQLDAALSPSNEFCHVAEEMRRRREEHIYTARRIFIAGSDAQVHSNGAAPSVPTASNIADAVAADTAKMDGMAQHSRHLNVNPQALDVLTPETRDKIRRFQLESQMLRYKSQRQSEELAKVESERLKIEQQFEKAKQELENEDFLDALADNPCVFYVKTTTAPDSASITSDYSTTSSNFAGSDLPTTAASTLNVNTPTNNSNRLMSQSFTGTLTSSDYSNNVSPMQPTKNQVSAQSTLNVVSISAMESVPAPPASPQNMYARNRLKHLDPDKSFLSKNLQKNGDDASTPSSSVSSITFATERRKNQPKVARSQTSNVLLGNTGNGGSNRSKAWYEVDDEDGLHNILDRNANSEQRTAVKTTTNGIRTDEVDARVQAVMDEEQLVAVDQRTSTTSRIGQKIKLRSKSSSADKRKDNRRHTLGHFTDMETIKTALFGSKEGTSPSKAHNSTNNNNKASDLAQRSGGAAADQRENNKQSRTTKFKAWFKESFRKSSPDLIEDEKSVDQKNI